MAAPFDVSNATTGEGQVLEAVRELIQAEEVWIADGLAQDPQVFRQGRFTLSPNLQNGTINISGTLPISYADSADGLTITASTYLP